MRVTNTKFVDTSKEEETFFWDLQKIGLGGMYTSVLPLSIL